MFSGRNLCYKFLRACWLQRKRSRRSCLDSKRYEKPMMYPFNSCLMNWSSLARTFQKLLVQFFMILSIALEVLQSTAGSGQDRPRFKDVIVYVDGHLAATNLEAQSLIFCWPAQLKTRHELLRQDYKRGRLCPKAECVDIGSLFKNSKWFEPN